MPRKSPYTIRLTEKEEEELMRRAVKHTLPYIVVQRARIILMAAQGMDNDKIAASLGARREAVSFWRKRFFEERLAGLETRPRSGRPKVRAS